MTEEKLKGRLPSPDWDSGEMRWEALPDDSSPSEWKTLDHGLNSTDLMVVAQLGGENTDGGVEWVVNNQVLLQLSDENTLKVRWNISRDNMRNLGLSEPRMRVRIWRY